jgi:Rrf2 family protein
MAASRAGGSFRKQQIAETEGISADYVAQILMKLKAAGLVGSRRGRGGGFVMGKDPDRITVAEAIEAMEGKISLASCDEEGCARASVCATREVWERASNALRGVLAETTIGDLARNVETLRARRGPSYQI